MGCRRGGLRQAKPRGAGRLSAPNPLLSLLPRTTAALTAGILQILPLADLHFLASKKAPRALGGLLISTLYCYFCTKPSAMHWIHSVLPEKHISHHLSHYGGLTVQRSDGAPIKGSFSPFRFKSVCGRLFVQLIGVIIYYRMQPCFEEMILNHLREGFKNPSHAKIPLRGYPPGPRIHCGAWKQEINGIFP